MGMRDEIQSELAEAFSAEDELLDAVSSFSCTRIISEGEYDPTTETYENSQTINYSGRGVLGNYIKDLVKPIE